MREQYERVLKMDRDRPKESFFRERFAGDVGSNVNSPTWFAPFITCLVLAIVAIAVLTGILIGEKNDGRTNNESQSSIQS